MGGFGGFCEDCFSFGFRAFDEGKGFIYSLEDLAMRYGDDRDAVRAKLSYEGIEDILVPAVEVVERLVHNYKFQSARFRFDDAGEHVYHFLLSAAPRSDAFRFENSERRTIETFLQILVEILLYRLVGEREPLFFLLSFERFGLVYSRFAIVVNRRICGCARFENLFLPDVRNIAVKPREFVARKVDNTFVRVEIAAAEVNVALRYAEIIYALKVEKF